MKCLSGFLALCVLSPVFSWRRECPPLENLAPFCTCIRIASSSRNMLIKCNNLSDAHSLSDQLLALKGYAVGELEISNSGPLDMVANTFHFQTIHRLTFRNCSFGILTLFSSLHETRYNLEELKFENCNVTRWIRSTRSRFDYFNSVIFINVNLSPIVMYEDFSNYPSTVKKLMINSCKIEKLGESALKRFEFLRRLYLEDNRLKSISRRSLAPYLDKLILLSLRGNPLETLSNGMFHEMPRLEYLYLGDTKLKTLPQEIFKPVWNHLEKVFFNNVWINCDCDSTWLIPVDWKKLGHSPSCLGLNKSIEETTHEEICATNETNLLYSFS